MPTIELSDEQFNCIRDLIEKEFEEGRRFGDPSADEKWESDLFVKFNLVETISTEQLDEALNKCAEKQGIKF